MTDTKRRERRPAAFTTALTVAFAAAFALALTPARADDAANAGESREESRGEYVHIRDERIEWAFLSSIAEGRAPGTAVQSVSRSEARQRGLVPRGSVSDGPAPADGFVRGTVSVQPFAMGWSGLDPETDKAGRSLALRDSSRLGRLGLADPVLACGLSFGTDSLFATTEIDFTTSSLAKHAKGTDVFGLWSAADYLSWWTFPGTAYVSWAGERVSLAAGRFRTGIGFGESNLFLNGTAPWYDHLEWSFWLGKFRFFSLWGSSSSQLNEAEYAVQGVDWDTLDNHDASTASVTALKLFSYHYLEFMPLDWLGLGLGEMQMIGGKVPELAHLLPLSFWHNTYSAGSSNVMLLATAWAVPLKGLLVRGEFVMDDSKAPSEHGTAKPNCWAWEAGLTWVVPSRPAGWMLTVDAEYSHADQWTYARWQPYLTMYQRQTLTGGWNGLDVPLGHPDGGDVDKVSLRLIARARRGKRIELGYAWTMKGPVYLGMIADVGGTPTPVYYDFDDWATEGDLDDLLGTTRKHVHGIDARVVWPVARAWKVDASVDFRVVLNAGHVRGNTEYETVWKIGLAREFGR